MVKVDVHTVQGASVTHLLMKTAGEWEHISPHQFNNPEDQDRDGLRNVGFYKTEPPYPAESPRKLDYNFSFVCLFVCI
jgi:hypothetical protein